ncbi:methylthioadenosine phosphorylase isoform X2 [Arctopsyche grandis]|uniref:methylthioadenosine phosphorylase isoform X2 n=1 Tax=Arctopsyche grandis TaxID=121162 RepID=UPI00406D8977
MAVTVKIGIIGGTGLDDPEILQNKKETTVETPFGSPSDTIIEGTINNVPCALLARHGRKHNIAPHHVNYRANIWALKSLGCTHVLVSTACGSLKEGIPPGSFVILDNFIDRTHGRELTFYDGGKESPAGICHIPMEPVFCQRTRQAVIKAATTVGLKCVDGGTCVTIQGPRFSTKAESNLFRSWGADIVNMTLVPEVVLAKEAGLLYAAVAVATDYDCWRDCGNKVNVADVLEMFKKNVEKVKLIFVEAVSTIAAEKWDDTIKEAQDLVQSGIM